MQINTAKSCMLSFSCPNWQTHGHVTLCCVFSWAFTAHLQLKMYCSNSDRFVVLGICTGCAFWGSKVGVGLWLNTLWVGRILSHICIRGQIKKIKRALPRLNFLIKMRLEKSKGEKIKLKSHTAEFKSNWINEIYYFFSCLTLYRPEGWKSQISYLFIPILRSIY